MLVAMSTTATVLGFFTLFVILAVLIWGSVLCLKVMATWYDNWRYTRRRKRKDEQEWSDIRSAWLREKMGMHRTDTMEAEAVAALADRKDTDVFPDLTPDYIENTYWKDNHDAA